MNIKKFSITVSLLGCALVIAFFVGYRIGLKKGALSTMPPMLDMQKFYIADRLATVVSDLYAIKSNRNLDQGTICDIKKIVLKQVDDWNSCKQNKSCKQEVSSGFYAKTDEKIADFAATKCDQQPSKPATALPAR